jgi:hypothetical protein
MRGRLLIYLVNIGLAIDVLANALLGGAPFQTVSCRIGLNIQAGGFWSRVPMPGWLRQHFLDAVFTAVV